MVMYFSLGKDDNNESYFQEASACGIVGGWVDESKNIHFAYVTDLYEDAVRLTIG